MGEDNVELSGGKSGIDPQIFEVGEVEQFAETIVMDDDDDDDDRDM